MPDNLALLLFFSLSKLSPKIERWRVLAKKSFEKISSILKFQVDIQVESVPFIFYLAIIIMFHFENLYA